MITFVMKSRLLLLFLFLALTGTIAEARVDWEAAGAMVLPETPLAVARAGNGDLTFILTNGARVLIYSGDNEHVGTVPVAPSVTGIAVSPKGETLYLIDSTAKSLQTVSVSLITDINVSGSPFLGPAAAQVAVAVFSDFQ